MKEYDISGETDYDRINNFKSTLKLMNSDDTIRAEFDSKMFIKQCRDLVNSSDYNFQHGTYFENGKVIFKAKCLNG
jgi:hypothetical protein